MATVNAEGTEAEEQAQAWHDDAGHSGEPHFSSCWCCCIGCDPDWGGGNPFWAAAAAAPGTGDE